MSNASKDAGDILSQFINFSLDNEETALENEENYVFLYFSSSSIN